VTLPRGFKAQAERDAADLRKQLGKPEHARVDVGELADILGVTVISAETLVERSRLEELEALQKFSFSAATFKVAERDIIVTNPLRGDARRASDVAHELAHILLKHELSEVRRIDDYAFRTCRPDQEEQATAMGGTLMLPRPLLLRAARGGLGPDEIAEANGVTPDMARYRYNTTGVSRQTARK
jgi:Zn-dependent peptidase ImmA (M78 family)